MTTENNKTNDDFAATETAVGKDLAELKPATERWLSLSEIAEDFGVSPLRIWQTLTRLGIRGSIKGLSRPVFEGWAIKGYLFSPKSVQLIAEVLAHDEHLPRRIESLFFKDGCFHAWRCSHCGTLLGLTDGERVEIQTSEGGVCLAGLPALCTCECNTPNALFISKESKGAAAPPLRIVHEPADPPFDS